jgi:long-chain acyl-CoA synthetase
MAVSGSIAVPMTHPRTLPRLFESSVERFSGLAMMLEKRGDRYQDTTYAQMRTDVHRFAAGLLSLGLAAGDRVALVAEGRNDWVTAELGILYCGAINVPVSVKIDELKDLAFRLRHAGCRMVIVSRSQAEKIRAIKRELPELTLTIVLDPLDAYDADEMEAPAVSGRGESFLADHRDAFDARWQSVAERDPANICYTSGTTADPKGIVLTHRNYTANVEQGVAIVRPEPGWVLLNILPWDHAFGHTCGIYMMMSCGATLASIQPGRTPMETLRNVPLNIRETRPTILLSVPALAKNFRKNTEKGVREKGRVIEALFARGLRTAERYNAEGWNRGTGARALLKPLVALYDAILFRAVRASFGGRLQFIVGGGALLDIELQRFFYAIGLPMLQGYGLTEAAPVISANTRAHHKLGSSGRVVPGLEIRICDAEGRPLAAGERGEIVVRGENVMAGYWQNDTATAEVLRDGWLSTGDLGYLDADGYLFVLGRVKSLLIADDGEKYSPEMIEEAISSESSFIEQVMLYNNQSPYTTALVVPSKDAVLRWARERGLSLATRDGQDAGLRLIEAELGSYREGGDRAGLFPGRWIPSAVAVLDEPFTEQNHLLNSTLKMVRGKILERYQRRIDELYTPAGRSIVNDANRAAIARLE